MIEQINDTRGIEPEAPQYNATRVRRVDLTPDLGYFWVRFDGEPTPFEPGQYMTIGVFTDGKLLQRPYSVASSPRVAGSDGYEFYVRHVPIIRFTTALWRLPVGHRMRMIGPKGKFLLEPHDGRTHLYVSTGTGIAPFLAMLRDTQLAGKPRRTILLQGSSYADEIGYEDEIAGLRAAGYPLTFVPTISRPTHPRNADWTGRTGRVEQNVAGVVREMGLRPDRTVVYICGNPERILNGERVLMDHGFPEFHVKKELYWPKGKEPVAPAGGVGGA